MNLFISDNFIDTVGQKVNVLQVIRQVAEDDDVIHSEVMASLGEVLDYSDTDRLAEAIQGGDIEDASLLDDTLYLSGELLCDVFEDLFPGDHTVVITNLVNSISTAEVPTLRLDHNCVPVVDRELDQSDVPATAPARPMTFPATAPARPMTFPATMEALFQGDTAGTEVPVSEVATLSSEAILGQLTFGGRRVKTLQPAGKNGVLFHVGELYFAIYNMHHDPDYLQQILIEHRLVLDPEDVHYDHGLYLSIAGLARLHGRLCNILEWTSLAQQVTAIYSLSPYEDHQFDRLGSRVV